MEKFDIFNPDGSPAGYSITRDEAHRKGLWHRTVHIWIINSRNELLIQKRSPVKETHPGKWDVSCAGHLSAGDDSIGGALRELHEELGLQIEKSEFRFLFTIRQTAVNSVLNIIDNEFSDVYLIRKDLAAKELQIQKQELTEVKFIPVDELKRRVNDRDPDFAPHGEEYVKLFGIVESRK
jgi:isopentenyldiphosphate isomerase